MEGGEGQPEHRRDITNGPGAIPLLNSMEQAEADFAAKGKALNVKRSSLEAAKAKGLPV